MSFPLICPGCGAASGPSVGICPFCKTVLAAPAGLGAAAAAGGATASAAAIRQSYDQGKLAEALSLLALADAPELQKDADYLQLCAMILIETEGPEFKIASLLGRAHLTAPANSAINDYLELSEAKHALTHAAGSPGEIRLRALVRRSPQNVHALFTLGAHLFWTQGETLQSIKLLEKAVQLRPCYLRAWGCLGSIYKKLGNQSLTAHAFDRAATLETDPEMKKFFQQQARSPA